MWAQHQTPLTPPANTHHITHSQASVFSESELTWLTGPFCFPPKLWNTLRQSKVRPDWFDLTASLIPEAVRSNPRVLFTPRNVLFLVMAKSNTTLFQGPAKHFILLVNVSKPLEAHAWTNPLAINVGVLQKKRKEGARGYMFLLFTFLSIFSLVKFPNQTWNKLSTTSIEVKEVICKEYSSKIRIRWTVS